MEKIIISGIFTLLAGAITAAISVVNLISNKESKISENRQQWTISARMAIADFLSKASHLMGLYQERIERSKASSNLSSSVNKSDEGARDHHVTVLQEVIKSIFETKKEMLSAYAVSRMHFKIDDEKFLAFESRADRVIQLFSEIDSFFKDDALKDNDFDVVRGKITIIIGHINTEHAALIGIAKGILKAEWEKIKKGEDTYSKTVTRFKKSGIYMLITLTLLWGYVFFTGVSRSATYFEVDQSICPRKSCGQGGNVLSAPTINIQIPSPVMTNLTVSNEANCEQGDKSKSIPPSTLPDK